MVSSVDQLCPSQLFAGGCSDPNCPLFHRAKFCDLCCIICDPDQLWSQHVNGRKHKAQVARGSSKAVLCPICQVRLSGESTWLEHVSSAAHHTAAHSAQVSPSVCPRDASNPEHNLCIVCGRTIPIIDWKQHLRGDGHQKAQRNALYRSRFEKAQADRGGVVVSHPDGIDFGVVNLADSRQGLQEQVTVDVEASTTTLSIARVETFAGSGNGASAFHATSPAVGQHLVPGQPVAVAVRFTQDHRGRFDGRLEIAFRDIPTQRTFIVVRSLHAVVGNAADRRLLQPTTPYVRRGRAPWRKGGTVVDGERPPALDAVRWIKKLPRSVIPKKLGALLSSSEKRNLVEEVRTRYLSGALGSSTHCLYFRVLLWVEEARMVEDLHMYDIENARLTKEGRLWTLPVSGLAEKRPGVVPGDVILAQIAGSDGRTHQGYVHEVRRDDIRIGFHSSFDGSARYTVRFQYNRTPIKRQHQALLASSTSTLRLLFPLPGLEGLAQALAADASPLTLFNALIGTNVAQYQAVRSIMCLRTGAAPFIVFGPPGTGKTVTVVEAILQILHRHPQARILATAPSNSAADQLAQRLNSLNTSQLFRCNAVFRDQSSLPENLVAYSCRRNNHFAYPFLETLQSYKVIVTTCGNASFAFNLGIPNGHFTHIFVDEAGQASEPEVLMALKTVAGPETRVVLSGDPKQLGPVIRSRIARELGLGKSYLERLMERPVYDPQTGRGRSFVKLLKNFRSHRAILDYPNEQFYDGELEQCGAPATINALLGSRTLPNSKWPVVFHHVSGENERESTSPSYFNIDEATEVLEYIKQLLDDHSRPVRTEEIGVITPYFAQVRKIRLLLRRENIEGVKVGSVEEFQGQERKVIIVSTVRSTRDLLSYDAKFTLGFVSNPRRFNVAVTRAQALLVCIGDASVLSIDPLWRAFMNYVYAHGGWRGDAPAWDTNAPVQMNGNYAAEIREAASADMEAFMARLEEGDDVEGQANVDLPFQEAE